MLWKVKNAVIMEKQTLLNLQPEEGSKKSVVGVVATVLGVMCVVLAGTLAWYHFSMQPKGQLHLVHLFALTRDVQAVSADFQGSIKGRLLLQPSHDSLLVTGTLSNLSPGHAHALHILSLVPEDGIDRDQLHWDTAGGTHGCPGETEMSHAGDLGNVVGDEKGEAEVRILTKAFSLVEILGRMMVITEGKDACTTSVDANIISHAALAATQSPKDFLSSK